MQTAWNSCIEHTRFARMGPEQRVEFVLEIESDRYAPDDPRWLWPTPGRVCKRSSRTPTTGSSAAMQDAERLCKAPGSCV
jgi:hypothetical protein